MMPIILHVMVSEVIPINIIADISDARQRIEVWWYLVILHAPLSSLAVVVVTRMGSFNKT